ncbi:hypothetical protein B0F90DRAFT_1920561 [Multifurca ochricompacta]|uniref:Uncharacterized protein n=1 Tax=Multifurca ochricompacta TaxID=376703 RepID=A0AAD4LW25_9AGAM|nr:hypothetical protein B0F90DRAFT_1920561 [Multifurca ochricompacta]
MYISTWSDDKVVVAPTKLGFNLDTLHEFIECYILLCKVTDHSADEVEKERRIPGDLESFRDGVGDEAALNNARAQGEGPAIQGGNPLIWASLQALEEYEKAHV